MTKIKMITSLIFATAILAACGNNNGTSTSEEDKTQETKSVVAKEYDYRIVAKHAHSAESYTQGLEYVDGVMWEGTGREGKSHLQRIDLATGKRDIVASLPKSDFGEGITHFGDRIYQLTWLSEKAYVYDLNGKIIKTIPKTIRPTPVSTTTAAMPALNGFIKIRIDRIKRTIPLPMTTP